ncbi:MAG TPA: Tad domain-containing protein [Vicinamibacterales bacterium]|nr:Tad domain-containing protein [Vicinamibacterales bacterium]
MRNRIRNLRRDERGMSFVFVGLGFMGFMAATTLAIDVGMFMTARSQAQNAADSGALAGAIALAYNDFDDRSASGPAVSAAISASQANLMMGGAPSVLPADVTFPNDLLGQPTRVAVSVYRTTARSNPIPTLIGPLLGVPTVDIGASATAEASRANAATCVKPFMIPDRWHESTGPFDPSTSTFDALDNRGNPIPGGDYYVPANQPGYTGYTKDDKGTELVLRAGSGSNIEPTAYQSWSMPGSEIGGDFYSDNIAGCNTTVITLDFSNPLFLLQEPGNMVGPTNHGIDELIAKDPGAHWDDTCECVKGSNFGISPRITPLPLYDPFKYEDGKANGRNADFWLANILGFFIDRREGNQVYGFITPISGIFNPNVGPAPENAFPVAIRLVE